MKQVIFIEWLSKGRDFEIDLPLIYFFEQILKWDVKYISIFDLPKILSTNPDIVIMSNTTGADVNLEIARWIEKSNILFFSHISEGMFREKDIEEFVWGWGKKEKYFSEILSMVWSQNSYDMAIKAFPKLKQIYRVSGSVGFDKYKLFNFNKIDTKGYKKVIGYACFDFHNIYDKKEQYLKIKGKEWFVKFDKLPTKINHILEKLVKENKDILFLFKSHPGDGDKIPMEFKNLDKYNNCRLVDKEISIVDVISNVDIWLNYNSSTNLEAWLLDKTTIAFNIDESTYSSDALYGSIICDKVDELQVYINEFYENGKIAFFEDKKLIRENLISKYIGFADGLNHIRFMSFLKPYIEKIENGEIKKGKWNISFKRRLKGYTQYIVYTLAKGRYNTPLLKKWAHIYDMFSDDEVKQQKELRYKDFDIFYENNKEKIDDIYKNYAIDWKNN